MPRVLLILLIFYIAGWFLFTYKLTTVPPGINGDEAAIGYLASSIEKTGHDSRGKFLPFFTTITWPDWKQPVTIYSTVAAFKLFGVSFFNLRAVSVFFVLLSGTIIFFLVKEIFDEKFAIISLLIFATIPINMIQSHLAIENIALVPFVSLWLWMLIKYSKTKKNKFLFFSALALGISIYSYLGLRLVAPILAILTVGFIFFLTHFKKNSLRPVLIFILGLLPFLLLAIIVRNEYPAAIFAANTPRNISTYQEFFLPFISSFDLSFLFIKGDITPYHSTGRQGMFLLATLPLFLLGLFNIARNRKPIYVFILLTFLLSPLLYGLPGSIYRASRLLVFIPPFIIITLLGIKTLLDIDKKAIKFLALLTISISIFLNYKDFVSDYWYQYPQRVRGEFAKPLHIGYEALAKEAKDKNLTPYVPQNGLQQGLAGASRIAFDFFESIYFPKGLKSWSANDPLPKKSVILVESPDIVPQKESSTIVKIDGYDYYLVITK